MKDRIRFLLSFFFIMKIFIDVSRDHLFDSKIYVYGESLDDSKTYIKNNKYFRIKVEENYLEYDCP